MNKICILKTQSSLTLILSSINISSNITKSSSKTKNLIHKAFCLTGKCLLYSKFRSTKQGKWSDIMYKLHRTNLTCVYARRKTWEKADHEASSGCLRGRGRQAGSLFTWGPGPGPAALNSCTAQGSAGSRIL